MGGALAEYALYDYATLAEGFSGSETTLTTFNGLGGLEALRTRRPTFNPSLVHQVDTAHFYITNDLANRLGGGHLNGNVPGSVNEYELAFSQVSEETGLPKRREDSSTIALDIFTGHRIESGFYAGFNRAATVGDPSWPSDFTGARAKPIQPLDIGGLARIGAYIAWLTNQDGALTTDNEALARLVAGVTYGLAYGNPSEVKTLFDEGLGHFYAAREAGEPPRFVRRVWPKLATALASSSGGIAARLGGVFFASIVESAADAGEIESKNEFVERVGELIRGAGAPVVGPAVDPMQVLRELEVHLVAASGGQKSAALYVSTGALLAATTVLALPSLAESVKVAVASAVLDEAAEHAQNAAAFARETVRKVANALREVASEASAAFAEAVSEAAKALVAAAIEVSRDVTDSIADTKAFVAQIKASVEGGLADVGQSIANAHEELVAKFADAIEWGVPVARQTLDAIIESLADKADADQAGAAPLLEQAIDALKLGGQMIAMRLGRGANPFDDPVLDPEELPLVVATLAESAIGAFTAYLPYEAGAGGQVLNVKLAGQAGELSVLAGGEEIAVGPEGMFTLTIPQGQREASFSIFAGADIDGDEAISISAALADSAGAPTHLEHEEATITLNGMTESAPTGGREIRGDWAPKEFIDPATGQVFYKWDDLANIEREPGSPNTSNFREPDSLFQGSMGGDHIVAADSADHVVALDGDDAITAGDRNGNFLNAGAGNDWAEAGRYELHEASYLELERWGRTIRHGEDKIYGGAGDDLLYGEYEATASALYDPAVPPTGRPGDWISGGSGKDKAHGGAGDDVLMGGLGEDMLVGGAGMDVLLGDDDFGIAVEGVFWTVLHPNFGTGEQGFAGFELGLFPVYNYYPNVQFPALIDPKSGDPYVSYYKEGGAADVLLGGTGKDILIGQLGDDTLYGGADGDVLAGWEGADRILGGAGDDLIAGEFGRHELPMLRRVGQIELVMPGVAGAPAFDDSVVDQAGNDFLDGGGGNDIVFGEGGDDVVLGGEGNDTLYGDADYLPLELHGSDLLDGGAGDDALAGGAGNDRLFGGDGDDTLSGGRGDDVLEGGAGSDTLLGAEDDDTLRGGAGADTLAGGSGDDLMAGGADDDQLRGDEGNDLLRGDAGADQLAGGAGNDTLLGGMGEDILDAGDGDDVLDGGGGADVLLGGAGDDTYLIGVGYGEDIIADAEGESRLRLGSSILPEDLGAALDSGSLAATLTLGTADDAVRFDAGQVAIGGVDFANGVAWSKADFIGFMPAVVSQGTAAGEALVGNAGLRNDLRGEGGDDRIEGGAYDDAIAGGDGNDELDGKEGSDRYFFAAGERGFDVLSDAGEAGHDVVEFGPGLALEDLELRVAVDAAAANLLSVRWGGAGFDVRAAEVESFRFADGATYSLDEVLQQAEPVREYLVARGSGMHELDAGTYDAVRLEAGIDADQLLVSRDGIDLALELADLSAAVRIAGWFAAPAQVPDLGVHFTRGPDIGSGELTRMALAVQGSENDDLLQAVDGFPNVLRGNGGRDILQGGSGEDLLEGGADDDFLFGAQGDDLYLFGPGDGADGISEDEDDDGGGFDTLRLESAAGDVSVERDFGDLVLSMNDGADVVGIFAWFREPGGTLERVELADGTLWNAAALEAMLAPRGEATHDADTLLGLTGADVLAGLGGDDEMYGFAGADSLEGGPGDDYLEGGKGDDSYFVSPGAQVDEIYEEGGSDRLVFGAGIAPRDVRLSSDESSLSVAVGQDGTSVKIWDWFAEAAKRVEEFRFADGTAWDETEIWNRALGGANEAPAPGTPIGDQDASEDAQFSFTLPADAFIDPDGDEIAYAVSAAGGAGLPSWLSFDAASRTLSGTPLQADVGAIDLRVAAADEGGLSASQDFSLLVRNVNDAPGVAVPIADQSFDAASPFVFAIAADAFADEDAGDTLTLAASLFGGAALPAWLTFDAAAASFAGQPAATDIGMLHLQVSAADAAGASVASDFGLVVRAPAGASATGGRGEDALFGGSGDETLVAKGGNDYLSGEAGDDELRGGSGSDVLQGGDGSDLLRAGAGQNVLDGGAGDDVIHGGKGAALIAGGAGNDTIRTGAGRDVIAFNRGDGVDTLIADRDGDNTLSFGGGIRYSDLSFSREGRNLVVGAGEDDRVVLKNWYGGKHSVLNLQIVLDASEDFDAGSADPLANRRVQTFDFLGLAAAFDAVRGATPGLTSWALTNALLEFHLSGADDKALGGDLAYWYGRNRSFAGVSLAAAQQVVGASGFGADAQTLRPFSGLQEGFLKLHL